MPAIASCSTRASSSALELSCRLIAEVEDSRIRHALATNLSDLLRYQNMLCRYDTMALKALDNLLGARLPGRVGAVASPTSRGIVNGFGTNVGSGGWTNIVDKYAKAKRYCDSPYEVRRIGSRNVRVPIRGERISERGTGRRKRVAIRCESATESDLAPRSLDAVFTDPPYFGNVQYGELMDFCYVWLRRLVGNDAEGLDRPSTRSPQELTGNTTQDRDLAHFTEGLATVYSRMARALKPGAPLAFTYHHNKLDAYCAVGVADPRRWPGVLRVAPLPRRNGRFDPHPRHNVVHHRHRLRLPAAREQRRRAGCSTRPSGSSRSSARI